MTTRHSPHVGPDLEGSSDRAAPLVSIGLPVYNGETYLRRSLDGLLAQTLTDFELIISDNASTDATGLICQEYAARDDRIRYVRQVTNIGAAPNHNVVVDLARGRYFKWASHDDLYHPELVRLCVEALEQHPEAALAHSWHGYIDSQGVVLSADPYPLDTANPSPRARLRSILRTPGGTDFYGVVPTEVMRAVPRHDNYYNADRTFVAGLALAGPFLQVPRVLYYCRQHTGQASHGNRRAKAAALGPARANRLVHPMVRMYAEYVLGFTRAVWTAPLSPRERWGCTWEVAAWMFSAWTSRWLRPSTRSATTRALSRR